MKSEKKKLHKIRNKNKNKETTNEKENKFFVFDIETNGLEPRPEKFLFGYVYDGKDYFFMQTINDFKNFFAHNEGIYFAHNCEYDLLGIFGNIFLNLDSKAVFNGSRFIMANWHKCKFYDSFNIFPYSLKNIGKSIGIKKMDISENLTKGKNVYNENDKTYCKNDCLIIYEALSKLFQITGEIKPTIASLSLLYFRKNYLKFDLNFNDFLSLKFFDSYYGGRCEAFFIGDCKGFKYDINSLYPYIMKDIILPNPEKLKQANKAQLNIKFLLSKIKYSYGQATIKINHKYSYVGYLPVKHENKLIFPNGIFTGTWTFLELKKAIEDEIIEILEIHEIIFSDIPLKGFFTEFITDNYKKRIESEGIYKDFYKLFMNNLYGKFGQKIQFESEYFSEIPFNYIDSLITKNKKFKIITFNKTRKDCFIQLEKKQTSFTYNTIPLIASYITSGARLLLLEYMLKHQIELLYTDTDSIFVTKELEYNSKELGEFKKENYLVTQIRGLKNYTQIELSENKISDKIKGISKNATEIIKFKEYISTSYHKTKGSLKRGVESGSINEVTKIITGKYNKRILLETGQTKPINL